MEFLATACETFDEAKSILSESLKVLEDGILASLSILLLLLQSVSSYIGIFLLLHHGVSYTLSFDFILSNATR